VCARARARARAHFFLIYNTYNIRDKNLKCNGPNISKNMENTKIFQIKIIWFEETQIKINLP